MFTQNNDVFMQNIFWSSFTCQRRSVGYRHLRQTTILPPTKVVICLVAHDHLHFAVINLIFAVFTQFVRYNPTFSILQPLLRAARADRPSALPPYATVTCVVYDKTMGDCVHAVSAYRADNFIIGLTNVSMQQQPPVLYNYTVCGQYPGSVPSGATVSLRCNDIDLPPARYVIVQFPITDDYFNFCELNVCAKGLSFFLSAIVVVIFRSPKFWRFLYTPVQFGLLSRYEGKTVVKTTSQ